MSVCVELLIPTHTKNNFEDQKIMTEYLFRKTNQPRNRRAHQKTPFLRDAFPEYIDRDPQNPVDHITFEIKGYRQGWWFNKHFFKRSYPEFYTTKRDEAIRLMQQHFDFTGKNRKHAKEAYYYFVTELEKYYDGTFLFQISW